MRVKLGAGAGLDILHGLRQRPGLLVGALAEQGIEYIDYRHNPRRQWDLLTSQLLRIALAIEVLVVASGDFGAEREVAGSLHHFARLVQDIGADAGMLLHDGPLFRVETSGLVQDMIRGAHLAHIVQDGGHADHFDKLRG